MSKKKRNENIVVSVSPEILSKRGYDFRGNKLSDETHFGCDIVWKKKVYGRGNRKNNLIELFNGNKFFRVVPMTEIRLINLCPED